MQWQDQCIILSTRSFSENSRIVSVFNRSLGKTSGLLRGLKQSIQLGDIASVAWRGRNNDSLGTLSVENLFSSFAFLFNNPLEILAIESACTLCLYGLPEKAPHEQLFESMKTLLLKLTQKGWLSAYVDFELQFLAEVGLGLDLSKCAVTGKKEGLFYISPKTGKAVIEEVGEKYKDRLFILPQFLLKKTDSTISDILCALQITEHFLKMYFCGISSKDLPLSRSYLIEALSAEELK